MLGYNCFLGQEDAGEIRHLARRRYRRSLLVAAPAPGTEVSILVTPGRTFDLRTSRRLEQGRVLLIRLPGAETLLARVVGVTRLDGGPWLVRCRLAGRDRVLAAACG